MSRALAATLAALVASQHGCAGPRTSPDAFPPSMIDPLLPCRTYRRAPASPSGRDAVGTAVLAGAAALGGLGALAAGGAARCDTSCTSGTVGAVVLVGAIIAGVAIAAGHAAPPAPAATAAARCDAQLERHCAGLADPDCRRALEAACAAADAGACWALTPPPVVEAPIVAPACREDVYPAVPCER